MGKCVCVCVRGSHRREVTKGMMESCQSREVQRRGKAIGEGKKTVCVYVCERVCMCVVLVVG